MAPNSSDHPPLLDAFFRENTGTVYYKAYPPYRGDDVQALVELAPLLSPTVRFVPVPPEVPHVFDSRDVMEDILRFAKKANTTQQRNLEHVSAEHLSQLLRLVRESLPLHERRLAHDLLQAIWTEHPSLSFALEALLPSRLFPNNVDPTSFVPLVPDEGPVLVIGRPALFRDDRTNKNPRSLQNVLRTAGFPNRFDFVEPLGDILHETESIRDRRTNLIYQRGKDKTKDDVGFVFLGFGEHRQPITVACGTSSFGTYSAVRLLMENRPDFHKYIAMQHRGPETLAVDIALRTLQRSLFGWPHDRNLITLETINSRNAIGFRWTRSAVLKFGALLNWWTAIDDQATELEFCDAASTLMRWTWKRPTDYADRTDQTLVQVRIEAHAYSSGNRRLLRSSAFDPVLNKVREHLGQDLWAWDKRRHEATTFRPILVVGETGTGKTIIADFIANAWRGATLQHLSHTWNSEKRPEHLEEALDQADKDLGRVIKSWPEQEPGSTHLLTFSAVAVPTTMLDRELFGVAGGYVEGSAPGPGVFVLAGTGVLFLDELLELPNDEQKRLLLVLQKGVVRPLGAVRDYRFACRLVAATNRVRSIEELNERIHDGEIRRDLIARFSHRYGLPALRDRPEEIIPLIIGLIESRIRRDHEHSTFSMKALRISHPAFEALIGFDFRENVRDLERFVDELSPELIEQIIQHNEHCGATATLVHMTNECADRIKATAILLSHLDSLLISRMDPAIGDRQACAQVEDRFYEFWLDLHTKPFVQHDELYVGRIVITEDFRRNFPNFSSAVFGDRDETPERIEQYEGLRNSLNVALGQFLPTLERDPKIREQVTQFCQSLERFMDERGADRLRRSSTEILGHRDWSRFEPICPIIWEEFREAESKLEAGKLERFQELCGISRKGHAKFVLSILSGVNIANKH